MRVLVVLLVLVLVPMCVAYVASAWRRGREVQSSRTSAEARELEASRDLIDRLLTAAIDHRDVDPLLAPVIIDEIRTHQRNLRRRSDE